MIPPPNSPPALDSRCPRKSSAVRIIVFSVVLAVLGMLLIPGYYIEERVRGKIAWQRYEVEARSHGVKLDFADFIPPKIPDSENFASIPIFDAAFRVADSGREIPDPFKLPKPGKGQIPQISDPIKQTTIDLAAWQKYFMEVKLLSATSDNAAADVLKALDRYAAPLAELRKAATRPHCRFPVKWKKRYEASLPHLGLLLNASKLCSLRLAAHLQLKQSTAASEDFHDGWRLMTAIRAEPSIIDGMVRLSIAQTMLNALWNGLAAHQWTEPELRSIQASLGEIDWLADFAFTVSSERGGENEVFQNLVENPAALIHVVQADRGEQKKSFGDWLLLFYPSGWHYQSRVRFNRYCDEMLAQVEISQHRRFSERPMPSAPVNGDDVHRKIPYMVFWIIAPIFGEIEARYVRGATIADEARIACALERFRLAHGEFPETLAELSPEFLPRVPAEIVNGEPYHYQRLQGGSFVLYSVGANLRDDGGVIDPKLSASKQLDWVWRYPEK